MVSEIVVNEFVAEAHEHLGSTECDLLAMESCVEGESCEIVDRLFRSIHSIKGGSGTFGFPAVMELSHAMESVLLLFRKGEAAPDHGKINILLQGVDKLKAMIDDIHSSSKVDCRGELEKLNAILLSFGKSTPESSPGELQVCSAAAESTDRSSPPPEGSVKLSIKGADDILVTFLPEAEQISSALAMQHFVFAIRADEDFLDKLLEFGLCLATGVGNRADGSCHYLFSTVLEPDLVATALSISHEQIQSIDPETLRLALIAPPWPETAAAPGAMKEKQKTPETIRVNVELLDILINLAGELVLGRNQLRQVLEATVDTNPRLRSVIQNVNLVTSEMQAHILQMRMQPVRNIFSRMHRLVRELCDQLSKEVELLTEGGQVELDKSILEGLIDPVVHIIRNCVDHGIETGKQRSAQGKPQKGQIRLLASHEGGQVSITISDDGRGMDPEAIVEKAVMQGLLSPEGARRLSEKDKLALIFLPGFSTAKTVTNVSGRGVGMDVVKTNVERFGGHVEIESVKGGGTTIRIRIPLTLAIISSLIVGAADQRFAIPQVNVKELVCIPTEDKRRRIEKVGTAPVL
ncbi:MAG: chemotaxis protein CheA, partial [Syntrophobacteraceae bacterium]